MKGKENIFNFLRITRTESSEVWRLDLNSDVIGTIHLHFTNYVGGDVILTKKLDEDSLESLLHEIENRLVDSIYPREDFIFSVFQANEIGFYSDIVDHELSSPTKKDLLEHKSLIQKVLSKYQHTRGQLNEHVVKEYFEKLGFQSKKSSPELDAQKVDIIAENETKIILCQVKLGKISERNLLKIAYKISDLKNEKEKIMAVVADSFPINIEEIKDKIEVNNQLKCWLITKEQILINLPEYKKSLK